MNTINGRLLVVWHILISICYEIAYKMVIYGVFIVSKSGGLIYNYDHNIPRVEAEKTFGYPLDIKLQLENKKVVVAFGQRDGIIG